MFGNKFEGDDLAKEFYKLMTLKKVASEEMDSSASAEDPSENLAHDLENHVEEPVVSPERFLNSLSDSPGLEDTLDGDIEKLDALAADDDCGDVPMFSDDTSYLMDHRATQILSGLGKIAGSLKMKGESFAADIVEATALSIKNEMVKEASRKIETLALLSKVASDISDKGDNFTADVVRATIQKIKTAQMGFDDDLFDSIPQEESFSFKEKTPYEIGVEKDEEDKLARESFGDLTNDAERRLELLHSIMASDSLSDEEREAIQIEIDELTKELGAAF